MAVTGTPRMVTDGLVLYLDAANTKSYPGSGTTWTDLSPSVTSSALVNTPTFSSDKNGTIIFNGTNNYVNFAVPNLGSVATVQMWVKVDSFTKTSGGMFFGWNTYGLYASGSFGFNTSNADILGMSSGSISSFNLIGNWRLYTFEMRTDVAYTNNKMYIDSSQQPIYQQRNNENVSNRTFNNGLGRIAGWRSDTSTLLPMSCSVFAVYNRSLTPAEISQNYEVLRERFSLQTPIDVEYLVVAGGAGGGGASGGGGGAGGLLSGSRNLYRGTPYTITVGAGGTRGVGRSAYATNGNNSISIGVDCVGGGRGGSDDSSTPINIGAYPPQSGGSGGGAGYWGNSNTALSNITGSATLSQGNPGGKRDNGRNGSGGGGAGSAALNTTVDLVGTPGGSGSASSITGVSTFYAGGGGGSGGSLSQTGSGGIGGGGNGGTYTTVMINGGNGVSNSGGGGGGGWLHAGGIAGNGGSGVVILAYSTLFPSASIGPGLTFSYSTSSRAGFHVYQFTGGTGTITL